MSRTRASAKAAGTRHESAIVAYLREHLDDDRVERRAKTGSKDRGDVSGVRSPPGGRVVCELKDYGGQIKAAEWTAEAHTEMGHDGAVAGLVIAKRRGVADPGAQWVLCTVNDLVGLLTGYRPDNDR